MQQPAHNAATAKFQLALPSLLTPISPHLAALHATRARLLYPADTSLATTHCTRCGSPFLLTGGRTRSVRKKRRKSAAGAPSVMRLLRRSCRACGYDDDVPLNPGNAPAFPNTRDRARRKSSSTPHATSAAATAAKPATSASIQQHAPVSQPHAPGSLQSPATPGSSRSSSLAPGPRSTPTPTAAGSLKPAQAGPSRPEASQAKSRPKKKAGLQSLLARNREKQEQEKKREGQGLSAFLQGL
ncbi:hypothetical protein BV20DRAFT_1032064 [Pilatotrama ljubarskyi]|nr:hypothetical protein BV20DRAFT_1032064 [Pilatotrama ljubarskyi]